MDGDKLNSKKLSDLVASELASRLKLDEKLFSSQIATSVVDKFAIFFEKNQEKYSSKKELANLTLALNKNTKNLEEPSKAQNKSESTSFFDKLKKIPEALEKKIADTSKNVAYKFIPDFLKDTVNRLVPNESNDETPVTSYQEQVTTEGRESELEHKVSSELSVKAFSESAISQLSDNFPDWIDEGTKKQTESLEKIQKAVEKMPEMLKGIKEAISDIETSGSSGLSVPGGTRTAWNKAKNLGKGAWNTGKAAITGAATWATTPIASMGTAGAAGTVAAGAVGGEIIGGMAGEAIGSNETVSEALYGNKEAGKEAYAKYGTGITGFSKGAYNFAFGEGAETRKQTAETEAKTAEMQKAGEVKTQKAEELVKTLGFKSVEEFKQQVKAGKAQPLKFNREKQEWSVNEDAQWNGEKKTWDLNIKSSSKQQVPAIVPEPVKEAVSKAEPVTSSEKIPTLDIIKSNPNKTNFLKEAPKQIVSPEEAKEIQTNVTKQAAEVVNADPKYLTASLNGGLVAPSVKPETNSTENLSQKQIELLEKIEKHLEQVPAILKNLKITTIKNFNQPTLMERIQNIVSAGMQAGGRITNTAKDAIGRAGTSAREYIESNDLKGKAQTTLNSIGEKATNIKNAGTEVIGRGIERVKDVANNVGASTINAARAKYDTLTNNAKNTITYSQNQANESSSKVAEKLPQPQDESVDPKKEVESPSTQFFKKLKKLPSVIDSKITNKTKDFAFNLIPDSVKNFASKFIDGSEDSNEETKAGDTTEGRKSALEKQEKQENGVLINSFSETALSDLSAKFPNWVEEGTKRQTEILEKIQKTIDKMPDILKDLKQSIEDNSGGSGEGNLISDALDFVGGDKNKTKKTRTRRRAKPKTKMGRALNAIQKRVRGLGSTGPIKSLASAAGKTTGKIADSAEYLKGTVKGLGAGTKVLGVAGAVLGAGMEFSSRKEEGQSNLQAGVGTAGGAAGAVAGAVVGQALIPIPVVGALIGGAIGGWLGGKIADAATGANDPIELWKNRVSKLENGKKYIEAYEKLPEEPKKFILEGLKSATEKESAGPGQIAAVDQQIVNQLDSVVAFNEEEKKKKEIQGKPSEAKPKAENKKEEVTTKIEVPAIVPTGVKDEVAAAKDNPLMTASTTKQAEKTSLPDYISLLKEKHENDPFKNKNYDSIASALVKQGITSIAQYEQAVKEGKIPKEFDQEFKKQYTRTSLGKEKGEEIFANKFENGLKAAQIQQAADVSPDQTNFKVSGTITEGKNVSDVSVKQIPSIVPEGVKNKVEGKEIKVPDWVPQDEQSQEKYKDIHSRLQDQKQKLQEEIASRNDQKAISATPAQTTNNFSETKETKTEKLNDQILQEISKNTKLTNEALANLAGGVQALAKAVGQMSGESGNQPIFVNTANQNPSNTTRNQADPTSTQFANLGNDIISSFRRGVELSRFTPA
jgi:hypothetical protein